MIFVEGDTFMMGSEDYSREKPVHPVTVSSFYIGKYPVTQALFKAVMKNIENPSYFKGDKRPVEQVSWFDAVVFCNALNALCGFESCYFSDGSFQQLFGRNTEGMFELLNDGDVFLKTNTKGYRLPTEAEWEFAARGGNKSEHSKYAGSHRLNEVAWYDDNSHGETKPVGLKLENELGLHDMTGNVWEWCYDWYSSYDKAAVTNPIGATKGRSRVLRGGGWDFEAQFCRLTLRPHFTPSYRINYIGFRLVLSSLSV